MTRVITYPIDLEQPYTITKHNEDGTLTVLGIAKTIQCRISENCDFWRTSMHLYESFKERAFIQSSKSPTSLGKEAPWRQAA